MTRSRSPLDTALDLLVYAPVGLVFTAAEELPKLAAKGRARVSGQVGMAKVVGQFAVAQGRKEIGKRLSGAAHREQDDRLEWADQPSDGLEAGTRWRDPIAEDADTGPGPGSFENLLSGSGWQPSATDGPGDTAPERGPDADAALTTPPPSAAALAIPGYDSLAASQVVPRLAGLSPEELAAVGAYESAHRARRTILTRIRQLQER